MGLILKVRVFSIQIEMDSNVKVAFSFFKGGPAIFKPILVIQRQIIVNLIRCRLIKLLVASTRVVKIHPFPNPLFCQANRIIGLKIHLVVFQTPPRSLM